MIAIIGLLANLIGTLILALALGKYYKWINNSLDVHELFIDSYSNNKDVIAVTGTDRHRANTYKTAKKWMVLGIIMILLGFALQLWSVIDKPHCNSSNQWLHTGTASPRR